MKKVLSILLSVVLAVTAVIGAAPLVYATPDGTQIPVVHVVGTGTHIIRTNENGETEKLFPFQIPEGYIAEKAEVMLPVFAKAFFTQEWDEFCDVLYEIVSPIFSKMALDNNGEASDGSHADTVWTREEIAMAAADGVNGATDYMFYYDWRVDPFETSDKLHEYIQAVMEITGSDKVALYGRCLGSNIVAAYMYEYGNLGHISDVIHYASAAYGATPCSKMFTGELYLHADAIENFVYDIDLGLGDMITDLIQSLVTLMNYTYGTDILSWAVNNVVEDIYLDIFPRIMVESYGTFPAYWTMVSIEDYDKAMETVFYGKDLNEYAGLIEKIEYYRNNVRIPFEENATAQMEQGIEFSNIVKYGYTNYPIAKNADELADGMVTVRESSFGATAATTEKTLSFGYLWNAYKNGTDGYISPDYQIDASTGFSRDTTWYIKNLEHTDFPECVNGLVSDIVNNKNFNINSNPEYPQFMVFDDETRSLSPMTEENMNTTDRYKTPFHIAFFKFIRAVSELMAKE
jgi:hypothetical protein